MDSDEWFTLAELAGRLGGLVWVEEQLADIFTGWSAIEAGASVAIHFAASGGHHRWHSEVIRGCLPTSPQLLKGSVVRAPTSGWESTVKKLRTLTDPEATVARLKAIAKVIDPWLERETGALQELARPISDAPMSRWLRFVTLDHDTDGEASTLLLAAGSSAAVRFDDHLMVNELDLS